VLSFQIEAENRNENNDYKYSNNLYPKRREIMRNKEKITTASVGTYIQKEKMISFFNCLLKKDMHLNLNATNKNTLKRINNVISSIAIGCKKRVAKIAKKRLSSAKYPHQYILALYSFFTIIYITWLI